VNRGSVVPVCDIAPDPVIWVATGATTTVVARGVLVDPVHSYPSAHVSADLGGSSGVVGEVLPGNAQSE